MNSNTAFWNVAPCRVERASSSRLRHELAERDLHFFLELGVGLHVGFEDRRQFGLQAAAGADCSLSSENSLVIVRCARSTFLHQPAQRGVLFVERELLHDDVDLALQSPSTGRRASR